MLNQLETTNMQTDRRFLLTEHRLSWTYGVNRTLRCFGLRCQKSSDTWLQQQIPAGKVRAVESSSFPVCVCESACTLNDDERLIEPSILFHPSICLGLPEVRPPVRSFYSHCALLFQTQHADLTPHQKTFLFIYVLNMTDTLSISGFLMLQLNYLNSFKKKLHLMYYYSTFDWNIIITSVVNDLVTKT